MKKYDEISKKEVYICNCCGQMIASVDECDRAAFLDVSKAWGYFSKWDGCIHRFQLCENCYGKMIQTWCYLPDEDGMDITDRKYVCKTDENFAPGRTGKS